MERLLHKVKETINKYNMIEKGDRILVAVSGGPDSVTLLHVLNMLKDELNISLVIAHVNHMLRDKESDGDEEYVKGLGNKFNIPVNTCRVDVDKYAREKGVSTEVAGREIRYDFFREVSIKEGCNKVAVAHNANDQVETFMMRLFRGSGIYGLRGIDAVRDNIIRPLIDVDRSSIEKFCEEMNVETRLDATNLENIYSRNKIRLDVLPYISENFNKDIVRTIMRTIDSFTIDNDYLEEQSYISYKKYAKNLGDKIVIDKEAFTLHKAVLSRLIRNVMKDLLGNIKEIEKKHIDEIILIQSGETGKELILPRRIKATNNYGDIVIQIDNKNNEFINFEKDINISGTTYIEELDITIECEVTNKKNINKFSNNYLIKYFDYDKIKKVTIRNRRDGDYFTPLGMKGRKKLKDLFINEKIDKSKRSKIPLILFDNEIAWIVGLRISEKFKITEETKRILIIQVKRGNCSE
ncbi:tRNA lysidine(34) synthetase TilS [Clostridium bornimense]|uniref:tRNA lysidine(34) synthetase TilS n=1 Tax=Clostridium bornimense TaxID=1216932 RepID=UPI001C10B507|nr:tRNA lysidine(34) synthetase TilS [Clostridium bornimense]MBU5315616.1 tRNA lysidine(34) synthetase TilS [Clostridium bornimense]